ncbi:hypothetical protein BX616_004460 [Lobosporangium transversale]|nr:hypothetical protein BX616_004460 [Lobosporangium transversale]
MKSNSCELIWICSSPILLFFYISFYSSSLMQQANGTFVCTYTGCGETFTVLFDWTRHVRKHALQASIRLADSSGITQNRVAQSQAPSVTSTSVKLPQAVTLIPSTVTGHEAPKTSTSANILSTDTTSVPQTEVQSIQHNGSLSMMTAEKAAIRDSAFATNTTKKKREYPDITATALTMRKETQADIKRSKASTGASTINGWRTWSPIPSKPTLRTQSPDQLLEGTEELADKSKASIDTTTTSKMPILQKDLSQSTLNFVIVPSPAIASPIKEPSPVLKSVGVVEEEALGMDLMRPVSVDSGDLALEASPTETSLFVESLSSTLILDQPASTVNTPLSPKLSLTQANEPSISKTEPNYKDSNSDIDIESLHDQPVKPDPDVEDSQENAQKNVVRRCTLRRPESASGSIISATITRGKAKAHGFTYDCSSLFETDTDEIKHYLEHLILQGPLLVCNNRLCRMMFVSEQELADHQQQHHRKPSRSSVPAPASPTPSSLPLSRSSRSSVSPSPSKNSIQKKLNHSKQKKTRIQSEGGKAGTVIFTATKEKAKSRSHLRLVTSAFGSQLSMPKVLKNHSSSRRWRSHHSDDDITENVELQEPLIANSSLDRQSNQGLLHVYSINC